MNYSFVLIFQAIKPLPILADSFIGIAALYILLHNNILMLHYYNIKNEKPYCKKIKIYHDIILYIPYNKYDIGKTGYFQIKLLYLQKKAVT